MKNFIVLTILAMLMASCSEQHLLDDYVSQTSAQLSEQDPSQTGIVNSYFKPEQYPPGTIHSSSTVGQT